MHRRTKGIGNNDMVSQARELSNRAQPAVVMLDTPTPPLGTFDAAGRAVVPIPLPTEFSKRAIDIALSLVLLALLSPVFLALAGAVRMSGRQILFRQLRVGRHGQLFECLKFRTMIPGAEEKLAELLRDHPELAAEWERAQKLKNDPRITRIGHFLRRTSLDELPQLWNVLCGDMSLVGPRPILPDQLSMYGRAAKWYLAMRPGITGLWQVTARGDGNFSRRIALDCCYVRTRRLGTDWWILFRTFWVVLSGRGAT